MSNATDKRSDVPIDVTFADGEPTAIEYFHATFGLMRLSVEGTTAILDPKWNRLNDRDLKDDFTRWITTGDVLYSVLALPFIDDIDASEIIAQYEEAGDE